MYVLTFSDIDRNVEESFSTIDEAVDRMMELEKSSDECVINIKKEEE